MIFPGGWIPIIKMKWSDDLSWFMESHYKDEMMMKASHIWKWNPSSICEFKVSFMFVCQSL